MNPNEQLIQTLEKSTPVSFYLQGEKVTTYARGGDQHLMVEQALKYPRKALGFFQHKGCLFFQPEVMRYCQSLVALRLSTLGVTHMTSKLRRPRLTQVSLWAAPLN